MKKLGIILDSSCGLSKKQAEEKGFMFLPIVIDFNGKEYYTGVDIDNEFLYKNMSSNSIAKTAAIKMGHMKDLFKKASKEYEKVLFVSLSKHLSSINSTAKNLAKNISDNIYVYDSNFITPWILPNLENLSKMLIEDKSFDEVINFLDRISKKMIGYIIPKTLDYLFYGGRITKAQYLVGSTLKIFTSIKIEDGVLTKHNVIKARTISKTFSKTIDSLKKDIEFLTKEKLSFNLYVFGENVGEILEDLKNKLSNEKISYIKVKEFLSPEIVTHIGPKYLGLMLVLN